jgi:hypothetical protein
MSNRRGSFRYILVFLFVATLLAAGFGCQAPAAPAVTPTPVSSNPTPAPVPVTPPPPPPAPTVIPSAKITGLTGEVTIKKLAAANWSKAEVGMNLESNDSIKTAKSSTATILYFEGSITELHENTEIRISELSFNKDTKSTSVKLWQQVGKTTNRVEKLVDPASQYEVDTPTGAAIARGSASEIVVYKDGSTTILNIEGKWYALVNGQLIPIPQSMVMWLFQGSSFSISDPGSGTGGTTGGGGSSNESEEGNGDFYDGPPVY